MSQNAVLVAGAGGFIGGHLVRRLKADGAYVVAVDLKFPEFSKSAADLFLIGDLRDPSFCDRLVQRYPVDEVYQLAAEMGGAGYLFTGEHDADILRSSALINMNVLEAVVKYRIPKVFFSSSACVYPIRNQLDPKNPVTEEDSVYPAEPDSDYGFEKLFSERLCAAYARNYGVDIRVARFHNVYGPENPFRGGREKVLGALCRKVAEGKEGDEIELWGTGKQTRSFLFIEDCVEGVMRLMKSSYAQPLNLGSDEMISIEEAARMVIELSKKSLRLRFIDGPVGVQGRTSDNRRMKRELQWAPKFSLKDGLERTYEWTLKQLRSSDQKFKRADTSPLVGEMVYDFFR
jgi:nucleoside-diphosphate-sugar epimerase